MLPSAEFGVLTGRALLDAWRQCGPPSARVDRIEDLVARLTELVIAADSLQVAEVHDYINRLVERLIARSDQPVEGEFVRLDPRIVVPERLYLSAPRNETWTAFARTEGAMAMAFSSDWVFQPEAS